MAGTALRFRYQYFAGVGGPEKEIMSSWSMPVAGYTEGRDQPRWSAIDRKAAGENLAVPFFSRRISPCS